MIVTAEKEMQLEGRVLLYKVNYNSIFPGKQ